MNFDGVKLFSELSLVLPDPDELFFFGVEFLSDNIGLFLGGVEKDFLGHKTLSLFIVLLFGGVEFLFASSKARLCLSLKWESKILQEGKKQ